MRPFPTLPPEIAEILNAEHLRMEECAQQPERWARLSEEDLLFLLKHSLIVSAIIGDERRWEPLHDLYGIVVARTSDKVRMGVFEEVIGWAMHGRLETAAARHRHATRGRDRPLFEPDDVGELGQAHAVAERSVRLRESFGAIGRSLGEGR